MYVYSTVSPYLGQTSHAQARKKEREDMARADLKAASKAAKKAAKKEKKEKERLEKKARRGATTHDDDELAENQVSEESEESEESESESESEDEGDEEPEALVFYDSAGRKGQTAAEMRGAPQKKKRRGLEKVSVWRPSLTTGVAALDKVFSTCSRRTPRPLPPP